MITIKKIEIITYKDTKKRNNTDSASITSLLFLLSGIVGILLPFSSFNGITYSLFPVILVSGVFCAVLWYTFFYKRKLFFRIALIALLICIVIALFQWRTLSEQISHIVNVAYGTNTGTMSVTLTATLLAAALSFVLFLLEFVLHNHIILFLLTIVMVLGGPLIGLETNNISLILIVLFQITFFVINMTESSSKRSFSIKNQRQIAIKSSIVVGVTIILAFVVALPFKQLYTEQIYTSVDETEGYIYRTLSQLSGMSANFKTDGQVSRGNLYRTGAQQLELRLNAQPTEQLYLRGFCGDIYQSGEWLPADDSSVFKRAKEKVYDTLTFNDTSINDIYFILNHSYESLYSSTYQPYFALDTIHLNGKYNIYYKPYYSYSYSNDSFYSGYRQIYYEQSDFNIDWNTSSSLKEITESYKDEAELTYTTYPQESLPRLTALCQNTQLDTLNEVTTFIVYTLSNQASYTLTPGMSPSDKEIVEYFLFENHKGYCVHYASVATLMYRIYGIPARYAAGFSVSPSAFNQEENSYSYKAVVTDESAHAWVEIFLEDYGWTPVDITPTADGSINVSYPGFDKEEMERLMKKHGWSLTSKSPQNISTTIVYDQDSAYNTNYAFNGFNLFAVIFMTCIVYSVILLPLFFDYRRLRRLKKMETMNCRKIFGLLISMLHFGGILEKYDGSEVDFADKLSEAIPHIPKDDIYKMIELVTKAAYGNIKPKKQDNDFVKQMYDRISARIYTKLNWRKKLLFRYFKVFG